MGTDSLVQETTRTFYNGPEKTKWQRLKEGVQWYRPGTTTAEKKMLFKLDCSILVFGCLSSFSKTLDNSSLTNAYVSYVSIFLVPIWQGKLTSPVVCKRISTLVETT
jgi:ACS family pantothenate transporter-like MFS transporter